MAEEEKIRSYRDLRVWQAAVDLVVEVYQLTECFPAHEQFGLRAQAREAVVSIPSNIAEGHSRAHRKAYLYHVSVAQGSLAELETHIEVAVRLRYCSREAAAPVFSRTESVTKQLHALPAALLAPVRGGRGSRRQVGSSPAPNP